MSDYHGLASLVSDDSLQLVTEDFQKDDFLSPENPENWFSDAAFAAWRHHTGHSSEEGKQSTLFAFLFPFLMFVPFFPATKDQLDRGRTEKRSSTMSSRASSNASMASIPRSSSVGTLSSRSGFSDIEIDSDSERHPLWDLDITAGMHEEDDSDDIPRQKTRLR